MKTLDFAIRALKVACLLLVMVTLVPVAIVSYRHVIDWGTRFDLILTHTNRLALEASLTMLESKKASHETFLRAQEMKATIATATGTLDEATQTLAQLKTSIAAIEKSTTGTIDDLGETSKHLNAAIDALGETIKATSATVNGPEVKAAITDLAASAKELNTTTKAATGAMQQAEGTISDVHQITSHYREQILKPVKWFKRVGAWLAGFSADIAAHAIP